MGDGTEVQIVRFNYEMSEWYAVKNTEMNKDMTDWLFYVSEFKIF